MTGGDRTADFAEDIERAAQRQLNKFRQLVRGVHPRHCPCCDYCGMFTAFGFPPRFDARCPSCTSLERHRLFRLFAERQNVFGADHRVLHVAPEPQIAEYVRPRVALFETADLSERRGMTHHVDITRTGLPDGDYDRIVCSHVLEHVDDAAALAELFRLLRPGGMAILAAPVIEGWARTYENPAIQSPRDRKVHFGQEDHVRLYGRDIRDRIRAAGFALSEFVAEEPDVLTHGLMRGEILFIAQRPDVAPDR